MSPELGDLLQGIGNIGQAVAAIVAIIGIPFIYRQVRLQARNSRLDVLNAVEDMWQNRGARAQDVVERDRGEDVPAHDRATATEQMIEDYMTARGLSVAARFDDLGRAVPYIFLTLCPTLHNLAEVDSFENGATNEKIYKKALLARCEHVFPLLDQLEKLEADDPAKRDYTTAFTVTTAYVDALNGIAELLESEVADAVDFMRRRHLAVIREVHAVEPFILWRTAHDQNGRWGMRVLALGEAARIFHWSSKLHYRREVGLAMVQRGALAIDKNYGCLLSAIDRRRLGHLLSLRFRRRATRVLRPFRDRNKLRQEKLIAEAQEFVAKP